jgi:diguanylate cyclase (GGDEF)-like protein/PAS domain S-box-containing protein
MTGMIILGSNLSPTGQLLGRTLRYLGITYVPVALLVFVYQYCGSHINRKRIVLVCVVPFISWLVLADPIHYFIPAMAEVVESEAFGLGIRKPYFWWVHLPYSYGILAVCLGKVFLEIRRTSKRQRRQIVMLFVAICFPIAADLLGLAGSMGLTGALAKTPLSPLSFLIFFMLMGISIYRYQFLGSSPIAYEMVFNTIRDSVIILDRDDIIQDINNAAAWRLDKERADIIGMYLKDAFAGSPDLFRSYEARKGESDDIHMTVSASDRYLALDITPVEERDGTVSGRILTLHDVTDRKQQQLSLETLAFRDPLTKLANRRKFEEDVDAAIRHSWETGKNFAILYFDLNRFKIVNDTLGHEVGDELLKFVAARTASLLRKPDILARMGGDEFAVLLHDSDEKAVERVVARMMENVERPFNVGEHRLTVGLSMGAAFFPADGKSLAQLLRHADSAMYRAKSQGGGLNLYSPGSEMEN